MEYTCSNFILLLTIKLHQLYIMTSWVKARGHWVVRFKVNDQKILVGFVLVDPYIHLKGLGHDLG